MNEPNNPLEQMTEWEQLDLGTAYGRVGKLDEAVAVWSNIRHDDNPEIYAWAQFNIGGTYQNLGRVDEAIAAWSNIRREDDP